MGEMSLRQDPDNTKRSLIATISCYIAIQMFKVSPFFRIYLTENIKSGQVLNLAYSRVPNKREGLRIIGGSWKWFNITMIGGGGCLEKLKIVVFLGKHVSFIYLCTVMLLIHLLLHFGSVECTS